MTDQTEDISDKSVLDRLRDVIESTRFTYFITAIILINAVTLGLETSGRAMAFAGGLIIALDRIILSIFVVEILVKLVLYRHRFFTSGWNNFDFVIVAISLIPATGNLSVLRALRILRVLRLISVVPQLRSVVQALLSALPGMGAIIAVLLLLFYVSAVLATKLFGDSFPQWFGTIGGSMYSLFQIMTLESWSMGIVRPVMDQYPLAWIFFVPFIVITSFAVLNLFIAIIVNSMQALHDAELAEEKEEARREWQTDRDLILNELTALRDEVHALRGSSSTSAGGEADRGPGSDRSGDN